MTKSKLFINIVEKVCYIKIVNNKIKRRILVKNKKISLLIVISLSIITLTACTKHGLDKVDNTSKADTSVSTNETTVIKNIQETNTTKIEGRKEEFIGRLDSIQKQLDILPQKKDSDAGITSAMVSYYRESYDMYDKALIEIYSLLKEQLHEDSMKNLQTEQVKWMQQKENTANKAALEFKGGTLESVAYISSSYKSTKDRCYELVENYMTN